MSGPFRAVDGDFDHATYELTSSRIESLFKGTRFGGAEKTDVGRRGLMIECVLKRASGYSDGNTITQICQQAGLLLGNLQGPSQTGIRWAFDQLYNCGGGLTILERLKG